MMAQLQSIVLKNMSALGLSAKSAARLAAVFFCGFLVGRVNIRFSLWPFGLAYMLAAFLNEKRINPYMAAAGVLTGLASVMLKAENAAYCFGTVGIGCALMTAAQCFRIRPRPFTAICAAAAALLAGAFIFKTHPAKAVLEAAMEAAICAMTIMIANNVFIFFCDGVRRRVLNDEEVISMVFCLLLCVVGVGEFAVFGIYLKTVAAAYAALLAAFLGGASVGAGAALAMGAACALSGSGMLFVGTLGICAMAAGVGRRLGKAGAVISFFAADMFVSFFINSFISFAVPWPEALLAITIFIITPAKLLEAIGRYVDTNIMRAHEQRMHMRRFWELTTGRLKEISEVFVSAAGVFEEFAKSKSENMGISSMIAQIPRQTCMKCMFARRCWDAQFSYTFETLQKAYASFEKKDSLCENDLPQKFLKKCIYPEKIVRAAEEVFAQYQKNAQIEKKVSESRTMVSEQLRGIARVMEALISEAELNVEFRRDLEEQLRRALDEAGIGVSEACVYMRGGAARVSLKMRSCRGGRACLGRIKRIVSRVCGTAMEAESRFGCEEKKRCSVTFAPEREYSLTTGAAAAVKHGSEVSGDTYAIRALRDGRHMMLLCDGMGSGRRAARESRAAVSLTEDFYHADFDDKTVIDTINKLLLLGNSDEIYSTMDLCMIDTTRGTVKFTKIGAPHSYIVRGENVKKLKAGSLPLGILDEFSPVVYQAQLDDGDIVVMFSDGIADIEESEDALYEIIKSSARAGSAQDMAECILAGAARICGGRPGDDMTVLTARIVKNSQEARGETREAV